MARMQGGFDGIGSTGLHCTPKVQSVPAKSPNVSFRETRAEFP